MELKTKRKFIRVDGRLREIITVKDLKGNVLQKIINPVMLEFYPRDIVQVVVGATILAVPIAFTEETWILGQNLPMTNILGLLFLSLVFISSFVYYNYYRKKLKQHKQEFFKRIISTYLFSFLVVSLILILIGKAQWLIDPLLAFKRTVIVTFSIGSIFTPFSSCMITTGAPTCNSKPSLLIVSISTDKCNSHLPATS